MKFLIRCHEMIIILWIYVMVGWIWAQRNKLIAPSKCWTNFGSVLFRLYVEQQQQSTAQLQVAAASFCTLAFVFFRSSSNLCEFSCHAYILNGTRWNLNRFLSFLIPFNWISLRFSATRAHTYIHTNSFTVVHMFYM